MNLENNQDTVTPSKKSSALFLIDELRYDGFTRGSIITVLMAELAMTKANASYYLDRVAKKVA